MTGALLAAFGAAVCYGLASVLQAIGASRPGTSVLRVTRSRPYLAGVALDIAGFLVSTVAIRELPLFSVQAIVASSVVVTIAVAVPVLGTRLRPAEALAVASVCAGLVMLSFSSASGVSTASPRWLTIASLGAAVLLAAGAWLAVRVAVSGPALAVLAGLAFGLLGLSVRLLRAPGLSLGWFADPAGYALVISGLLALWLYAASLQRWKVTSATAVVVALDTLVPATVGLLWLGDRAQPGRGWLAAGGFVAALGGAVVLARLGAALDERDRVANPARVGVPELGQNSPLAARP